MNPSEEDKENRDEKEDRDSEKPRLVAAILKSPRETKNTTRPIATGNAPPRSALVRVESGLRVHLSRPIAWLRTETVVRLEVARVPSATPHHRYGLHNRRDSIASSEVA